MKAFYFLFFLLLAHFSKAQAPNIQWQKSIGSKGYEQLWCIIQTTDGGYALAGHSDSIGGDVTGNHGSSDYWIVKLNSNGTIQWQKCLGGPDGDIATCIVQTKDGGYIVTGKSIFNGGDVTGNHGDDYWVVKLSSNGTIQWQKCLGGSTSEYSYSIIQTTDGGYVVSGFSGSQDGDVTGNHGNLDYWIVKLNSTGSIEWQKSIGGSGYEETFKITQTTDGGYAVIGCTFSTDGDVTGNHGKGDIWVVKLNSLGTIQWQKTLGGSKEENGFSIIQTFDGGYAISGWTNSNDGDVSGNHGGSMDSWIVKLSNTGSIQWQKAIGGSGDDRAISIFQTSDGGYIINGWTTSNDGDVSGNHGLGDMYVVKLNSVGNIQWHKTLGGKGNDGGVSIVQTLDGGYAAAGYSDSIGGDVTSNHGDFDYWIVKLAGTTNIDTLSNIPSINIYPNPSNSEVFIKSEEIIEQINILSSQGNLLNQPKLSQTGSVDISTLPNGSYIVEIKTKNAIILKQIVKF